MEELLRGRRVGKPVNMISGGLIPSTFPTLFRNNLTPKFLEDAYDTPLAVGNGDTNRIKVSKLDSYHEDACEKECPSCSCKEPEAEICDYGGCIKGSVDCRDCKYSEWDCSDSTCRKEGTIDSYECDTCEFAHLFECRR